MGVAGAGVAVGPGGGVGVGFPAADAMLMPPKTSNATRKAVNSVRAICLGISFSFCASKLDCSTGCGRSVINTLLNDKPPYVQGYSFLHKPSSFCAMCIWYQMLKLFCMRTCYR